MALRSQSLSGAYSASLSGNTSGTLIASAGPDTTLVYGTATALAGSASGGAAPYTYAWSIVSLPNDALCSFSDATSPTSNATLTGPNGTFTLRLTVTDVLGHTATDDVVLTLNATLADILGSARLLEFDATNLSNGAVSSWASTGTDTGATLAQATGSKQPVRAASSFNSLPGVTFDGTDDDLFCSNFTAAIASGSRPYLFVVGKYTSAPAAAGCIARMFKSVTASNIVQMDAIPTRFRYTRAATAGADTNHSAGAFDTGNHIFSIGFTSQRLCFAIDGCELSGTKTDPTDDVIDRLRIGSDGTFFAASVVAHVIVCSSTPDTQQMSAVHALLRTKWNLADTIMSTSRAMDLSLVDSLYANGQLAGCETIGDYVYILPWAGTSHQRLARWNTKAPFKDPTSWEVKALGGLGVQSHAFATGCTDGRYLYGTPFDNFWCRYDSQAAFSADASYAVKDLRDLNGGSAPPSTSGGAVYDGSRYVYIVPGYYDDARGHIVVRYDTQAGSFTANASYTTFDTTTVDANCCGYLGAGFDGRYVYFSPYAKNGVTHGQFLRYDTTQSFTSAGSWETFDLTTVNAALKGINGIAFDGTYVYLCPGEVTYNVGDGHIGARYNPAGSFTSAGSYTTFDFAGVDSTAMGFMFPRYDGSRYLYYPQEHTAGSVAVLRYDTQASYTAAGSYKFVDARQLGFGFPGYVGGAACGQHRVIAPTYGPYALKTYGNPAS